ncbi:MAG: hypothetical protein M0Z95_27245 [Actinomycetota bacterium]|jgi:hypothetical protein|nr:hypothetical protein [Actinomycetota bacterium]
MHLDPTTRSDPNVQRIRIAVDLIPGPLTEAVAGRLLDLLTEELHNVGADIANVAVEVQGLMAGW